MFDRPDHAVDDLGQVVRRNIGGHADRDAGRPVDEQIRVGRREHRGFLGRLVIVRDEVDRLLVEVGHQVVRQRLQLRLGITHRRRRVAVDRPKVPLTVDQGIPHVETLRHPNERVVDGGISVGVEIPHDLADDLGALAICAIGGQPHQAHAIDDPAMGRFETVPHIGQRTPDDDAHGIVHVGAPHLVFDVDGRFDIGSVGHMDYSDRFGVPGTGVSKLRAGSLTRSWRIGTPGGGRGICVYVPI